MVKFSEKMLLLMAASGFIIKGFYFEPAGGFLLFMSLAALSGFYLVLGWRLFRIEIASAERRPQFFFSKLSAVVVTFGIWAFLVKLFTLPYPGWLLLVFANLAFLILFIYFKAFRLDFLAHRFLVIRTLVAFVFCFSLMLIPSHSIIRFFYRNDPPLAEHLIRAFDYPDNEQFYLQLKQYKFDAAQKKIQEELKRK
ncbi:MAG: hypothetical protein MUF42_11930 [Cytophagaceae bacterium]|jgi:hypothetical protein|nr:hypothetical protein [Cytophagaceae bacterium]